MVMQVAIKVNFISLGCPKNQIDSEVMLAKCVEAGMEIVQEDIDADVVVINTCAFIDSAKSEAIETILDVNWLRENHSLKGIVCTGCLAQRYKDELFSQLPEIDAAIGVGNLDDIVKAIEFAYENGNKKDVEKLCLVDAPEKQPLGGDRVVTTPEYSVYIKISEGCDNRCAYCIIPSLRGKFRSRPIEDIVAEAKEMVSLGAKELIIVSQDTTKYGKDLFGEPKLDKLLQELCKIDGVRWIRLLYCYAEEITPSLVDTIAKEEKIVKYIDMPIQHLSDNVLRLMNRRDTNKLIYDKVAMIREKIPDCVLRTTVITGFPGETGEDFSILAKGIEELKFERLGAFAWSDEEGTAAHEMSGKLSEKIKKRRMDTIMLSQMKIHEDWNKKQIGKTVEVLCEGYDGAAGVHFGRSKYDAPEIDGKVYFSAPRKLAPGSFVNVKITTVVEYDLFGEAVML